MYSGICPKSETGVAELYELQHEVYCWTFSNRANVGIDSQIINTGTCTLKIYLNFQGVYKIQSLTGENVILQNFSK